MKKIVTAVICLFVMCPVLKVQAANVTFEPQEVKLRVAPGETGRTYVTAHGYSNKAHALYFLVGSKRKKDNIPRGWLTTAYLWLDSKSAGTSSNTMNLIVDVPPDAEPGTYTAILEPEDMRSSEPIVSPGVNVTIEVTGPAKKKP